MLTREPSDLHAERDVTLSIIGAGGHARVVADAAEASGHWHRIQLYDDTYPEEIDSGGWPIVGTLDCLLQQTPATTHQLIIASGDNQRRHSLQSQLQEAHWPMATVIHPSAMISARSQLGAGSAVLAGAIINPGCRIGSASIINSGAIVEHDCQLGHAVHISPGAVLSGKVMVGNLSWIGAAAVIIQSLQVGEQSVIGAGSTVIHDLPNHCVAVGSPARIIRQS
ncbi:acetyltransferase [Granulosicoccus sp. 3-233]|uniref:acetyltransferase n=1 Tax=Granulosicoccus sp. 3-233 TaxID=3417969 RepID=UPI003D352D67